MSDFNPNDHHRLEIREDTRRVLDSINVVRNGADATDQQRLDLLHELVEAGRATLNPRPKTTPAAGGTGRGRKPKEGQA